MLTAKLSLHHWLLPPGAVSRLCLLLCWLFTPMALAATAEAPDWVEVGHGSYKRFFLHVYDVKLEALQTHFHYPDTTPYALTLVYQLDLDADVLVDNTLAEWNNQKLAWPKPWLTALKQYLPDISKGDSLRLEVKEDHSAVFFYNAKAIVTFTDQEFVHAFVGIWLSEHSSNSSLRNQLLGPNK